MPTHFANLKATEIDQALATFHGVPVTIAGDPPFTLYVRQHRGANRRTIYVAGLLFEEFGIGELEGVARGEAMRALELEVAVRELVAGWDGLVDDQGDPIEITQDAVRDLLTQFPDVLDQVLEVAQDETRFRLHAGTKSDP